MYEKILVPTDGSEATTEALEHALDLAERHDATVEALYVVDERKYNGMGPDRRDEARETLERKGERAVEEVAMRAVVVQHAQGTDVDVIVIGTHGRSRHGHEATLGSVTRRVVENATVPVFVVHIDTETE
jgi:nucleotide-binding universal stress UspA family protein